LIKIDDWKTLSKELKIITFELNHKSADVLHVPGGYYKQNPSVDCKFKIIGHGRLQNK
jgi:hypothetical protein